MVLMDWLAKKDDGGLVFPNEFTSGKVRIYGRVHGNPDFEEGEYIQTAIVVGCDGKKVYTMSGSEYFLGKETYQYKNFLRAMQDGAIIVKKWSVRNGNLVGRTLDSAKIEGRVVAQNFRKNICTLEDGTKLFVDWLDKDPKFKAHFGPCKLLAFGTENCMPDIFCDHYNVFKGKSCR